MPQSAISDYGFLSDCQSAALVGRNGAIDWYCPARFDAPAIFARLLDPNGGHWFIRPVESATVERAYLDDTLVLRTVFHTATGVVSLVDALLFAPDARGHEIGREVPHIVVRHVECLSGSVELECECAPRLEYGLIQPNILPTETGIRFSGGATVLHLQTNITLQIDDTVVRGRFTLRTGEHAHLALAFQHADRQSESLPGIDVHAEIANTVAGWRSWAEEHDTYTRLYAKHVRRSAMILQGLTFQPSGAIVAAATTSLPEADGGPSNWDYRYVWLRDWSFTMHALFTATCSTEIERCFQWLAQSLGANPAHDQHVPIVLGVSGEHDLSERELAHLRGFRDSAPVRVGNAAWKQTQLDVLGEVIDVVFAFREHVKLPDDQLCHLVVALANKAATHWREPDAGMWEARDQERHYLSSKVLCWVALDRAVKMADWLGTHADLTVWQRERDAVRAAILEQGWSKKINAFAGAFGSDNLDASVLLMPLVGFLPANDPRMRATIDAIATKLVKQDLVYRWDGDTNGFLLCTYWLVECLAQAGEWERAKTLFEKTNTYANDLGLLAEMADPQTHLLWGNYPQTLSHVGLINAACTLAHTQPKSSAP